MLLGKNKIAKIADFGLSRDIYEAGLYQKTTGVSFTKNAATSRAYVFVQSFILSNMACFIFIKGEAASEMDGNRIITRGDVHFQE